MDQELIWLLIGLAIFAGLVFAVWVWDKLCYTPWLRKEQNRQELNPVKILNDFEKGCILIKPDFYNPWGE